MKNDGFLMSRRGFLASAVMAGVSAAVGGQGEDVDENLSVFFSDIHISGENIPGQPTYQNQILDKAIDQVLAMRPRPKRVVVFGDIALWEGFPEDYAVAVRKLRRITDAGIELTVTTGNHDRRRVMSAAFPEQLAKSPVPGRFASVVDLGTCDLLLLDIEPFSSKSAWNNVYGTVDKGQFDWVIETARTAKRPFLLGAHYAPQQTKCCDSVVLAEIQDNPLLCGYVHGDLHRWGLNWYRSDYSKRHVVRVAGLPSVGWWGSIGFTTLRTFADRAELVMAPGNDFFFPKPLDRGERRPVEWDDIAAADRGGRCVFHYDNYRG